MKKPIFLILCICLLSGHGLAQDKKMITGTVVNAKTNEPLVGASVELILVRDGAVTDLDGFFVLQNITFLAEDTLLFNYLGFIEQKIALKDYETKSIVYLESEPFLVEGIEVEGERLGFAQADLPTITHRIEADRIELKVSGDIKSVFREFSSVQIVGNPIDGSYIQIRGSNSDEVNVYVDGFLLNSFDLNNRADISLVNTENIKNMQVQKGGNMLLQGMGASGGVVNIETMVPNEPSLSILSVFGDSESRRLSAEAGLPLTKNIAIKYSGVYTQSNPELRFNSSLLNPNIDDTFTIFSKRFFHDFNTYYMTEGGKLTLRFALLNNEDDKGDWVRENGFKVLGASYIGSLLNTRNWQILVNHNWIDQTENRYISSFESYLFAYDSKQLLFKMQKMTEAKFLKWTVSYEFFHDELENKTSFSANGEDRPIFDGLSYDNLHSLTSVLDMLDTSATILNLNWRVFGSFRYNTWLSGQNDFVTNFSVLWSRQMRNKRWEAHLTYGRNVKYPTLIQNAFAGNVLSFGPGEDDFLDRLEPEYFTNFESGGSYLFRYPFPYIPRLKVEAALFVTLVRNKILQQPVDQSLLLVQKGENRTTGIEAGVYLEDLLQTVDLSLTYTQLEVSNPLSYAYKPDKMARLNISYARPAGLYMSASVFYEGNAVAWYYDADNEVQINNIDPFTDMDITLGWRQPLRHFSLNAQIAVRNALDNSTYQDFYLKRRFIQFSLGFAF